MRQRGIGITLEEIEQTLNDGWEAADAKPGTFGKVMVFPNAAEWEGHFYPEKEECVLQSGRCGIGLADGGSPVWAGVSTEVSVNEDRI
jgi:hypothetical protein